MTWLRKDENGKNSRKLSKTIVVNGLQQTIDKIVLNINLFGNLISDSPARRIVANQFDKIFRKKDSIATNL